MDNEEPERWLRYLLNPKYAVSTHGRIVKLVSTPASPKRLLVIKQPSDGKPYFCSVLTDYVGAIVLETFVGSKPFMSRCEYKDGNKQNHKLSNLYWATGLRRSKQDADS